jgi:putative ATPase
MTLFDLDYFGSGKNTAADSSTTLPKHMPLAARMRPQNLEEFLGQEHLVGRDRIFRKLVESDQSPSMVLWGPPGSGKTTLAHVIAKITHSHFVSISAVSAGVSDLRQAVNEAKTRLQKTGQRTILFIDEIHRFSKSQQDSILPYVENGTITLISATTENPSFEVISPLLSRCKVYTLKALTNDQIRHIVERALKDEEMGLGRFNIELDTDALSYLINIANGDARSALNTLEMAVLATASDNEGYPKVNLKTVEDAVQQRALLYDKGGDQHYDLISALHKSLRGSDPDASLYWLGRMLEAGEDPLFIVRRLIRFASEDIGIADPQALVIAVAAQQAVHFIGMPEGNLALAEAVIYLATAPKSNSLYTAYSNVQEEIEKTRNDPVPLHLRNPATVLMKRMGYGKDYKYPHKEPGHFLIEKYLPDSMQGKRFYFPGDLGFEKEIKIRLQNWWRNRLEKKE